MACIPIRKGFICTGGPVYEYEGVTFEIHSHCGPTPLSKRDGAPLRVIPNRFWALWDRFSTEPDREQFRKD